MVFTTSSIIPNLIPELQNLNKAAVQNLDQTHRKTFNAALKAFKKEPNEDKKEAIIRFIQDNKLTSSSTHESSTGLESFVKGVKNLFRRTSSTKIHKSINALAHYDKTRPNKMNNEGRAPIRHFIHTNREEIVKALIQNPNVDLNKEGTLLDKYTPLLFAVQRGYIPIAKLLIESGKVDLRVKDSRGNNVFHLLCKENALRRDRFEDLLKFMEEKCGPDLNSLLKEKNEDDHTPYEVGKATIANQDEDLPIRNIDQKKMLLERLNPNKTV